MLALYPLWRKARRVYSLTSRLPGTNRLGFQPSLALSDGLGAFKPELEIRERILQILLVLNAIHFSGNKGTLRVSSSQLPCQPGSATAQLQTPHFIERQHLLHNIQLLPG
ncbi:MAG: hypothetical protein ABW170_17125 [Candidatus Thiodiazotropha sp. L084R]